MSLRFNLNRQKLSDEEINRNKNFDELIKQFKEQSLKKAQGDESWWKNKKIKYSTIIAGVTVICTISYIAIVQNQKTNLKKHETNLTSISSSLNPTKAFIKAPSQKIKLNYKAYKINAGNGGTINHTSSTKISIPKNSFVDKNGKELIGEVSIEYKEMHDLGDIILSGIPMMYDSAGKHHNLESAGMFDIRGYQNGEAVFIKPGKEIAVSFASNNPQDRFNQYYLDTLARNWQYIKRDNIQAFDKDSEKLAKPKSVSQLNQMRKVWAEIIPQRIDSVGQLYVSKTKALSSPTKPIKPNKSTAGRPIFVIEASSADFPELAAYENLVFEVGAENKNYRKEMHEITWTDVKITQGPVVGKNYILNLIYRSRSEKLIVYPVLVGEDYTKAEKLYEKQFQKYENLKLEKQEKEKRLLEEMQLKQAAYLEQQKALKAEYDKEKERSLLLRNAREQNELLANFNNVGSQEKTKRLFMVNQFGIYNSDCPHPQPDKASVTPLFVLNGKSNFLVPDMIYFVDHDSKTVNVMSLKEGYRFYFDPEKSYSICLFKNSDVFTCSKKDFRLAIESSESKFVITRMPSSSDEISEFKKTLELY